MRKNLPQILDKDIFFCYIIGAIKDENSFLLKEILEYSASDPPSDNIMGDDAKLKIWINALYLKFVLVVNQEMQQSIDSRWKVRRREVTNFKQKCLDMISDYMDGISINDLLLSLGKIHIGMKSGLYYPLYSFIAKIKKGEVPGFKVENGVVKKIKDDNNV